MLLQDPPVNTRHPILSFGSRGNPLFSPFFFVFRDLSLSYHAVSSILGLSGEFGDRKILGSFSRILLSPSFLLNLDEVS